LACCNGTEVEPLWYNLRSLQKCPCLFQTYLCSFRGDSNVIWDNLRNEKRMSSSTPRQKGYPVEIFGSSQMNEKFLCTLCHLVLRLAVQRFCGHRYCKDCADTAADTACPACEREGWDEELPPEDTPQVSFRSWIYTICDSVALVLLLRTNSVIGLCDWFAMSLYN